MFCHHCGKDLPEGTEICSVCGNALATREPAASEPAHPSATLDGAVLGPIWSPRSETSAEEAAPAEAESSPPFEAVTPIQSFALPAGPPLARVAPQKAFRYAGFWKRFLATLLDLFVISSIEGILMQLGVLDIPAQPSPQQAAKIYAIFLPALWLYYAIMESSPWQATLGKRALDLCVTDLQGRRISFARASGRFFGHILSSIILWLGFLMVAFTERKQALHDMLAGCIVIRRGN